MKLKFLTEGTVSISARANDEDYDQSQCRFLSILAKDPPTIHHGLRMDRNRRNEGYHCSQRRFLSILAKDPPTHHHGLRMDRNRRFTAYLDEVSSLITVLEMLTLTENDLTKGLEFYNS